MPQGINPASVQYVGGWNKPNPFRGLASGLVAFGAGYMGEKQKLTDETRADLRAAFPTLASQGMVTPAQDEGAFKFGGVPWNVREAPVDQGDYFQQMKLMQDIGLIPPSPYAASAFAAETLRDDPEIADLMYQIRQNPTNLKLQQELENTKKQKFTMYADLYSTNPTAAMEQSSYVSDDQVDWDYVEKILREGKNKGMSSSELRALLNTPEGNINPRRVEHLLR